MEAASSYSPLLLVLSILFTPGCSFLHDRDNKTSSAPLVPHFTECISRDRTTFRCWWSPGSFQNLSYPEDLKIFFRKKSPTHNEWKECPQYDYLNQECFFDANHTSAWSTYCLELNVHNVTYKDEYDCFTLESIVRPDPPVSLNWTLLSTSPSGLRCDVLVSWEPPPSADVGTGWMLIEYEVQFREINSTKWNALEIQSTHHQSLYGLRIGQEYEVHIHTRMRAYHQFGLFSPSIFIKVEGTADEGTSFPVMLALIFGISGIVIIIMFIVMSQHHRLTMILLPPVPAPKIKGIDSELLKKGKFEELNFILSGGLPTLSPDFYQEEPWVEFIEVEPEGADSEEKEENQSSDTQRLLSLPQPVSHQTHMRNSTGVCFPDDDSGRASCYDSDHPDQDPLIHMGTLLPGQPDDRDMSASTGIIINAQTVAPQTWVNTDFYAQVTNVMPSGGVVLSPGQQLRLQEHKRDTKNGSKNESCEDLNFQLVVVDPEGAEDAPKQNVAPIVSPGAKDGYHTIPLQPAEPKATDDPQSPYILPPESPQTPMFSPVADYTVVQEVDSQRSLLLNPPPQQQASPPSCPSQHPLKSLPAMPVDYISPDLFGNLSQ